MSPMNWDTAELRLASERSVFWTDHDRDMEDPEYREAFVKALSLIVGYRYRRVLDLLAKDDGKPTPE